MILHHAVIFMADNSIIGLQSIQRSVADEILMYGDIFGYKK
jgi:hypothetical protein